MAQTIVSSHSHRVRIAPNRRTVVIGERCNTLGYKKVRETVMRGEWQEIISRAKDQFEAGAGIINVNMVGLEIPERTLLPLAVSVIRAEVDAPLSLDFGDPEALDAALGKIEGRTLINSVSGEIEKLETIMPIAKKHNSPMIALLCDDDGIPYTPEGRLKVAEQILRYGEQFDFTVDDFIFDCVGIGIATDVNAGQCTLDTMELVRKELDANITLGASNVSFGMPKRRVIDAHYLSIAISRGMNAPLTDIMSEPLRWALFASDAIMGKDKLGIKFIREARAEEAARIAREQDHAA
jgi:5-methyltetrahydrofolate--homocysteine methyltransferase